MQVSTTQAVLGLFGSALSGGLPTIIWQAFAKRQRRRALADSGIDKAINEAVETALKSTTAEIGRLNTRSREQDEEIARLKAEMESMRLSHSRELAEVREKHEACEERTQALQRQIAALMGAKPADYQVTDLKRVGKP